MVFHQQFVWFFMFLLQNRNLILFWPGWYAADDCEWMGFSHLVLWGYHYHTPNLKCSNLISRLQNNTVAGVSKNVVEYHGRGYTQRI
ncbi:hypothetical protein E1A91_D05G064200v1 [Gossypium mustelinum]|uniref:Uncharacterized protein n=2 Tax=Gossypium TaxID=3633 RepID=A0A5J5RA58_GOSBA|nr:hypothetical protein ES319_D05G060100v1 [Gossypium barbadense]TYI80049.1 hypothetical protein E1A91_D05G064200v1 [Gossypium mustelinum]